MTSQAPDTSDFTGEHLLLDWAPDGWEHIESVISYVRRWHTYVDCYYRHKETGQYYCGERARGNTECQEDMFTDVDGDTESTDQDKPAQMQRVTRQTVWEQRNKWTPHKNQTPEEKTRSIAEELHRAENMLTTIQAVIDELNQKLSVAKADTEKENPND